MILILTDENEPTTDLIIDWLIYLKKDFVRFSFKNEIDIEKIYYNNDLGINAVFNINKENSKIKIDTKDITSYWYRRSDIALHIPNLEKKDNITNLLIHYLKSEYGDALRILGFILNSKNRINKYSDNNISKVEELCFAKQCGLIIPDFIVCTDKVTLFHFFNKYGGNIITKTLGDPSTFFSLGFHWFTNKVNMSDVPDNFALSFFQQMIEKKVELRIFYLHGKCYSSAIFSQKDKQTQIDFRHYNEKTPNRVVPYNLPYDIEQKIVKLMNMSNLNSGSIDMILTPNNEYVFLEVNPIGQFEQVSFPCNYNLPKKIAEIL
ncbi:MAG: grasp-with-spasm system ATP-grasp peptide maturase [Bacteroidia bacterium]|nr:grasp-with-spasm system ATP-grasp peptide maturase [Bacteroidia bacterium]